MNTAKSDIFIIFEKYLNFCPNHEYRTALMRFILRTSFLVKTPLYFLNFYLCQKPILLLKPIREVLMLWIMMYGQVHMQRKPSTFPTVCEGSQMPINFKNSCSLKFQFFLLSFRPRFLKNKNLVCDFPLFLQLKVIK